MFKIHKDDDGKVIVRPVFIGFIKNDVARRFFMIALWPLTVMVTWSLNYIWFAIITSASLLRLTFHNVRMCFVMPWHHKVWKNPRTK